MFATTAAIPLSAAQALAASCAHARVLHDRRQEHLRLCEPRRQQAQQRQKRMAIDGALLKEGMRQPKTELKWIIGLQNISDILTKDGADMEYFRRFLQDNSVSWTQDPASAQIKERKRAARGRRKGGTARSERRKEARKAECDCGEIDGGRP